jgi:hypothetical protein
METEGPPLETVLRRIAEVPADFLAEPRVGNTGVIAVPAVVYDLAQAVGLTLSDTELTPFLGTDRKRDGAKLAMVLLLCWTLQDEWVRQKTPESRAFLELLTETAAQLVGNASAAKYINDPDRREELARLVLSAFGLRPAGESRAQAQDRLSSISSVERNRVLKASRAAEERARAIREALAKKAAEESADKWTRE